MTDVITNAGNIIYNYGSKNTITITDTKAETFFIIYRLKKFIRTDFAQQLLKENIIKNKAINNGRSTIKGTRITPEDVWRIIDANKNVTIQTIYDEYPSLEKDEQILAAIIFYMKNEFTWRKVLFSK